MAAKLLVLFQTVVKKSFEIVIKLGAIDAVARRVQNLYPLKARMAKA